MDESCSVLRRRVFTLLRAQAVPLILPSGPSVLRTLPLTLAPHALIVGVVAAVIRVFAGKNWLIAQRYISNRLVPQPRTA